MTLITHPVSSGTASINTRCVLVDTDGRAWIVSGSPVNHGIAPADAGQLAALQAHFGGAWTDAVDAMTALVD